MAVTQAQLCLGVLLLPSLLKSGEGETLVLLEGRAHCGPHCTSLEDRVRT